MRGKNEQKHRYSEKEVDFTGQCFFYKKCSVSIIFAISERICVILYQFFAFIAKRYFCSRMILLCNKNIYIESDFFFYRIENFNFISI